MFGVGTGEMLMIMVVALVLLGPDRLPKAARQAGSMLSQLKRVSEGFQQEFRDAMDVGPTGGYRPTPQEDPVGAGGFTLPAIDTEAVEPQALDPVFDGPDNPAAALADVDEREPDAEIGTEPSPPVTIVVDGPSGSFS